MRYKLCRLKPFNPRDPSPRTFTLLANARYPRSMTFEEAKGWYKVEIKIADELEVEMLDGKRVFDVCTHQQAMAIDRAEALARERKNQRAQATNPHNLARPSASEWANDPDFGPAPAPRRASPAAPPANFRGWDETERHPAPAARPVDRAPARPGPEDAFPSPDENDTTDFVAEALAEAAEAEAAHPSAEIGDENDGDTAADADAALELEPAPTAPAVERPKRGRPKKQ